ncbi:MAG: ABC transporter ATP-binding protein [Oxalobacter formigenes]|nr:ABC transporter ATP-binding protein [Oxalobacter formigenes]
MKILKVEGVGKSFKIFSSPFRRLLSCLYAPWGHIQYRHVLEDISFSIDSGESLGIIGVNGAGKSTLLKIIAGVSKPTVGRVSIRGRVSALLELGMGFHPDFTGRQNIYMASQILAYPRSQIDKLFDEIVAFSEVADYIDRPVRMYSSGMQVRLAFAVATAIRPDLLIVDEALSVGDVFFQQKCMERIREYQKEGMSLIFVTHDMNSLHSICDHAFLLDNGRGSYYENTREGVEDFLALNSNQYDIPSLNRSRKEGNGSFDKAGIILDSHNLLLRYLDDVYFTDINGRRIDVLFEETDVYLIIKAKNLQQYSDPAIGIRIQDHRGTVFYETNTYCMNTPIKQHISASGKLFFSWKINVIFARGNYTLAIGLANGGSGMGDFEYEIAPTYTYLAFCVMRGAGITNWSGTSNLRPKIFFKEIDE